MAQIFISHSQRDNSIKNFFSAIFGRTNVKALLVEYENLSNPAWPHIQRQIEGSAAMFILLGPNVETLRHTQIWIGSETGAAAPLGKEVWVFEPLDQPCEVPIPHVQHYMLYNSRIREYEDYIQKIIESYDDLPILKTAAMGGAVGAVIAGKEGALAGGLIGAIAGAKNKPMGIAINCPNCETIFRLHTKVKILPCPTCRKRMEVKWL